MNATKKTILKGFEVLVSVVHLECHKASKSIKGGQYVFQSFKGAWTVLKGCFKGVSMAFQGCFNGVSRVFQGDFKMFQGSFKVVLRKFQESFK